MRHRMELHTSDWEVREGGGNLGEGPVTLSTPSSMPECHQSTGTAALMKGETVSRRGWYSTVVLSGGALRIGTAREKFLVASLGTVITCF